MNARAMLCLCLLEASLRGIPFSCVAPLAMGATDADVFVALMFVADWEAICAARAHIAECKDGCRQVIS